MKFGIMPKHVNKSNSYARAICNSTTHYVYTLSLLYCII